ncbi:zinc dependent phospholipase C family protein [Candidatus Chloroploca asiatica]|uniref:Phospholipase C/D domain-containing protein n=1 Tax=Candidatus Chloroploca asiatica TaxID=1506545 RepID=A0A2H3L4X8_9CHLR|nr:zinc dependent phospholipase C family protein [Candidatus Chloroploca asiatica]PDV98233.1 hypothetical protein A9Q02_16460 [Candidatus Chloroploca asiatica]
MPKYAIHSIVVDEVIAKLRGAGGEATQLASLMQHYRPYTNLGAVGPDMLFFAPDYGLLHPLSPLYDYLLRLFQLVEGVEAALDQAEKVVNQALEFVALDVLTTINDQLESIENNFETLLNTTIAAGLLVGHSPLDTAHAEDGSLYSPFVRVLNEMFENFLKPPCQDNREEPDWYWFDMLHYRNTGDFAAQLVALATTDAQKAYAMGYLTHYATDLVGHPFVNQIVGAPYRLAVQRHVTVENFMDAWEYAQVHSKDKPIYQHLFEDLQFDTFTELPDEINNLLRRAFAATYGNKLHPLRINTDGRRPASEAGFLNARDLKTSFLLMKQALKLIGGQADNRPIEPFAGASEILSDLMSALNEFQPMPSPPDLLPPNLLPNALGGPGFTLEALLVGLQSAGLSLEAWSGAWMSYLAETVVWALETALVLVRMLRDLIALGNYIAVAPLLAILYGIDLALYHMLMGIRKILVWNGLVYPAPSDLDDALSASLFQIFDPELHFMPGVTKRAYPMARSQRQSHLIPPNFNNECRKTTPAFHTGTPSAPARPTAFIRDERFDPSALHAYAMAASPAESQALRQEGRTIGNAVDLCTYLIQNTFGQQSQLPQAVLYANWNLDGDRGYAAKSWAGILPHVVDPIVLGKLSFVRSQPGLVVGADNPLSIAQGLLGIADDGKATCRSESDDYQQFEFKAKFESYNDHRRPEQLRVAPLTISEAAIPHQFVRHLTRNPDDWRTILSFRLRVRGRTRRENVYHVNGIFTPAYNAFYEADNLERFFRQGARDRIRVHTVPNWSDNLLLIPKIQVELGRNPTSTENSRSGRFDPIPLLDVFQALNDKRWPFLVVSSLLNEPNFAKLASGEVAIQTRGPIVVPSIGNPTTVAFLALLYDAFKQQRPLGLIGYSQGSQIIFNAVLAFALQGHEERNFLQQQVKIFFVAPMVDQHSRTWLARVVLGYDQIIVPGDPVPGLVGNFPLVVPTPITAEVLHNVARDLAALDAELHNPHVNFPLIQRGTPNHQGFF